MAGRFFRQSPTSRRSSIGLMAVARTKLALSVHIAAGANFLLATWYYREEQRFGQFIAGPTSVDFITKLSDINVSADKS